MRCDGLRPTKPARFSQASRIALRAALMVLVAAAAGWPGPGWSDSGAGANAVAAPVHPNASNPAALYCRHLGYGYEIVRTPDGEKGVCIVSPGVEFDAWEFFKGKVGQEYSYAARHGYDMKTKRVKRGECVEEYAVCISRGPDRKEIPLLELMERNGEPLTDCESCGTEPNPSGRSKHRDVLARPQGGAASPRSESVAGSLGSLPSSFDWRSYDGQDWITPVKDQAACGSCWAFSAVGAVEAKLNIDNNDPALDYDLSEQHLVSCECPGSCNGGFQEEALEYIIDPGVADETCFPYLGCKNWNSGTGTCIQEWPCNLCTDWQDTAAYITGYEHVANTQAAYKQALVAYGPLAIALDATGWSSYSGGIFVSSPAVANHAVVLVGYNDTDDYWIVKNSWGSSWGESGYIRLSYTNNPITTFDSVFAVDQALEPIIIGALDPYTVTIPTKVGSEHYFEVRTGVTCVDGSCGDVTAALSLPLSAPTSGSAIWGGDCSEGPPESFDNTFDTCSPGAGGDESIYDIYLDKYELNFGETIEVTCTVEIKSVPCGYAYTGDRLYIYYRNCPSGVWQKKLYVPQVYSCYDYSVRFVPDNVEGEHQVRCIVGWNIAEGSCASGSYFDNDDVNFYVYDHSSGKGAVPYFFGQEREDFEVGFGAWTNVTGDDFDWTRHTGATPSANTGPAAAHGGRYYVYTESNAPNSPSKTAILEGPTLDLDHGSGEVTFAYHMYGSTMGSLYFEIEDGVGGWTSLWSKTGDQGNEWHDAAVDLTGYSGSRAVRFRMVTGSSSLSDAALDDICFPGQITGEPFYTMHGNPTGTVAMAQNDTWEQAWLVKATGALDSSWPLHARYTSNYAVVAAAETASSTITIVACPGFTGAPNEYTYTLNGDTTVTITDTVPDRDGATTVPGDTPVATFAGVAYNLVVGTNGDDVLTGVGTVEDDALGLNGNDVILGFGGNDTLRGVNGDDVLFGGDGHDRLYGDNDDDILVGGDGNDTLYTGAGDDTADGGGGDDLVVLDDADDANDSFEGGSGANDRLILANGYGSFGMTGLYGFESFTGGDGDDVVDWSAATVPVVLRGNAGNDTLTGGAGADLLTGGAGNDTLTGGGEADTLYGNTGSDTLSGGGGNDRLYGDNDDDVLSGGDGDDTLYTGSGDDTADGGDGDDLVVLADANDVNDSVEGGVGNDDTLLLANGYGSFAMSGLHGFERFTGGDGNDAIDWSGATARVVMRGNGGNDTLRAGSGNDLLTGGPGSDALYGGQGHDRLYGDAGEDHLIGGGGDDRLYGGADADDDFAHYSDAPVAPRYDVRDRGSYLVVFDTWGTDGRDIVRQVPEGTLAGPYVP